jgi:hypothetical protein
MRRGIEITTNFNYVLRATGRNASYELSQVGNAHPCGKSAHDRTCDLEGFSWLTVS